MTYLINMINHDPAYIDDVSEAIDLIWGRIDENEQNAIIDAYDKHNPEDTEHYFFEEWLAENWEKYFSDYMGKIEENDDCFIVAIPTYALAYLINGDSSGLNDVDSKNIDDWYESMRKEGKYLNFEPMPDHEHFVHYPVFGLGTDCTDCYVVYI